MSDIKEIKADLGLDKGELNDIADVLVNKFNEALEKQVKSFNVTGNDEESVAKKNILDTKARSVMFLKALNSNDVNALRQIHLDEVKSMRAKGLNEGTNNAGGYLVPEEFDRSIAKYDEQYNQIMRDSTTLRMNTDTMRLNSLTSEPVVTITGEKAAISGTTMVFGEPVLTPKKYAAILDWTTELEEDAELMILDLIAERIGRAISKKEQVEFISGATSGSEGLLAVSGVTSRALITGTGFSSITWDDLSNMITDLQEVDLLDGEGAKFYMAPSVFNVLRKLKASTSGEYFVLPAPQDNVVAQAWGYDIVLVNQMPTLSQTASATKFVLFSNLKKHAFVGQRRGITLKVLEESTISDSTGTSVNLGTQDARALRVTKRTAFVTALQSGIVTLTTN